MEPFIVVTKAAAREVVDTPRYHHRVARIASERVIVQWTRSGYGMYRDAQGERMVPAGEALVIVVPSTVEYYYPEEAREIWLIDWADFRGALATSLFGSFLAAFGPVVPLAREGAAGVLFQRLISEVASGELRDAREMSRRAYAFVLEWWREASQGEEGRRLQEVVEACTGNGVGRMMTVKELAAECGLSREHFTRCFTRQMGVSPATWLRQKRLAAVAESLREHPGLTLAALARETGFVSGRHLSASFRRAYGVTVEEFRRSGRDAASSRRQRSRGRA